MSHPPSFILPLLGLAGVQLGRLVGISPQQELLVEFEGPLKGPVPARLLTPLSAQALKTALETQQEVALLFEQGNPQRPLVLGLIQPLPDLTPLQEPNPALASNKAQEPNPVLASNKAQEPNTVLASNKAQLQIQTSEPQPEPLAPGSEPLEVRLPLSQGPLALHVEQQRVVLESQQALVLRCGPASITLQPDGRVLIKGTDVISHARGLQRLRGAAIQLN